MILEMNNFLMFVQVVYQGLGIRPEESISVE